MSVYGGPHGATEVNAAGGLPAIAYVMRKAWGTGEFSDTLKRLKSKNTCKTCALGMGGQNGGMVNEVGHFPEVCKKSVQAQAADMQPAIPESYFRAHDLTALRRLSSAQAENLGRLGFPIALRPGADRFERVTWDEALRVGGDALRTTQPDRTFWYASGRSGNESAFLMQLIARAYGSPNIHNCSFYCHNASTVALTDIYGSGTASTTLDDLSKADLVIVAGANPASNHPRLVTQLITLRRRGGKVIVVNPLSELGLRRFRLPSDARSLAAGSQVSDLYLQPRIGVTSRCSRRCSHSSTGTRVSWPSTPAVRSRCASSSQTWTCPGSTRVVGCRLHRSGRQPRWCPRHAAASSCGPWG